MIEASDNSLDIVFEALANKHRRSILYTLGLRHAPISELANDCNLSLPAIHKHIKVLENSGLVNRTKSGRSNFLSINASNLSLVQAWLGQFQTYWKID